MFNGCTFPRKLFLPANLNCGCLLRKEQPLSIYPSQYTRVGIEVDSSALHQGLHGEAACMVSKWEKRHCPLTGRRVLTANGRVTDGARTRDLRSHNPYL